LLLKLLQNGLRNRRYADAAAMQEDMQALVVNGFLCYDDANKTYFFNDGDTASVISNLLLKGLQRTIHLAIAGLIEAEQDSADDKRALSLSFFYTKANSIEKSIKYTAIAAKQAESSGQMFLAMDLYNLLIQMSVLVQGDAMDKRQVLAWWMGKASCLFILNKPLQSIQTRVTALAVLCGIRIGGLEKYIVMELQPQPPLKALSISHLVASEASMQNLPTPNATATAAAATASTSSSSMLAQWRIPMQALELLVRVQFRLKSAAFVAYADSTDDDLISHSQTLASLLSVITIANLEPPSSILSIAFEIVDTMASLGVMLLWPLFPPLFPVSTHPQQQTHKHTHKPNDALARYHFPPSKSGTHSAYSSQGF
jgi:hypothetical protein